MRPLSSVTVIHCVSGIGCAARFPHRAVVHLRIHAHRLRRLQAPEQEVEVVRRLHRRRRQLDAAADLLAQAARDVAAHQRAHRLADRAVADALAHVGELRVEALRVADGELELLVFARARSAHRLRRARARSASRGTRACPRRGNPAPSDSAWSPAWPRCRPRRCPLLFEQLCVVRGRGLGAGLRRHLGEAVGALISARCRPFTSG